MKSTSVSCYLSPSRFLKSKMCIRDRCSDRSCGFIPGNHVYKCDINRSQNKSFSPVSPPPPLQHVTNRPDGQSASEKQALGKLKLYLITCETYSHCLFSFFNDDVFRRIVGLLKINNRLALYVDCCVLYSLSVTLINFL